MSGTDPDGYILEEVEENHVKQTQNASLKACYHGGNDHRPLTYNHYDLDGAYNIFPVRIIFFPRV